MRQVGACRAACGGPCAVRRRLRKADGVASRPACPSLPESGAHGLEIAAVFEFHSEEGRS